MEAGVVAPMYGRSTLSSLAWHGPYSPLLLIYSPGFSILEARLHILYIVRWDAVMVRNIISGKKRPIPDYR